MIAEKKEGEKLDEDDIFLLVLRTYKPQLIWSIILFWVDALFRLTFSALIIYLFQAVAKHDTKLAYIYIAIEVTIWYISQLIKQSSLIVSYTLSTQLKAGLAMLLYAKVSKMTCFSIKSS